MEKKKAKIFAPDGVLLLSVDATSMATSPFVRGTEVYLEGSGLVALVPESCIVVLVKD